MQSPLSRESVHTTLAKPAKQLMAGCTPSSQVDGDATTSITAAPPHCICLSLCAKFHLLSFCWCLRVLLNRSAIWVNVSLQTNCQQRDGPHLTVGASWLHPWMHNIVRSKDPWWWKWHMRWETIMWPLQQHNATTSEWSWQQTDVQSELLSQQPASLLWSHHIILITPSTGNLHWLKHPLLTITHCHSHKTVDSASRMCQPTPFEMTPKPLPQWYFRGSAWQISPCACKAATWAELARFACSVCEGVSCQTSSCLLATESLGGCLEAVSNKHSKQLLTNT